jgi:hypothetical protein
MTQRRKDNYEPACREKWLEFRCHEFEYAQDKADIDRMARTQGAVFLAEFRERREVLRKGGMNIKQVYRTAIGELADRIPTREECKKGAFRAYERNRRASQRNKDEHDVLVGNVMSRMELHAALAGKKSSVPDIEWVAENFYAGVDILALDPADIPSRTALNRLESAISDPAKFWAAFDNHEDRKASGRVSLSDSGRSHVEVMQELFAERDVFDGMMETADVAVGT